MRVPRRGRPPPTPDCAIPGEKVAATTERAYRRGFMQGVAFATRAVEAGASPAALRDWLDRLHLWRLRVQRAREYATAQLPPMPRGS